MRATRQTGESDLNRCGLYRPPTPRGHAKTFHINLVEAPSKGSYALIFTFDAIIVKAKCLRPLNYCARFLRVHGRV